MPSVCAQVVQEKKIIESERQRPHLEQYSSFIHRECIEECRSPRAEHSNIVERAGAVCATTIVLNDLVVSAETCADGPRLRGQSSHVQQPALSALCLI